MTRDELIQVVTLARHVATAEEEAGLTGPPEPGDLVVETSLSVPDPDAIGNLVWCGYAPYDSHDFDKDRFVWDIYPLSGAPGLPICGHGRLLQRWENATFRVVRNLEHIRLFASALCV